MRKMLGGTESECLMAKRAVKHVGFKGAVAQVRKGGYSAKSAAAIVASASRKASPAAKRRNPRLKRVSGGRRKKK